MLHLYELNEIVNLNLYYYNYMIFILKVIHILNAAAIDIKRIIIPQTLRNLYEQ